MNATGSLVTPSVVCSVGGVLGTLEFSPFVFCRCVLPPALVYHSHKAPGIETHQSLMVCSWPYTLPEHKRLIIQKDLPEMLKMGVLGESHISWCSP